MKKLLGSTLALAMVASMVPVRANAELLKNFKMSGSLETDSVSANNVTDFDSRKYDEKGYTQTRVMIHADWDLLDDVHAHTSLDKNNRAYGSGAETATAVEGDLTFDEAYIKIDKLFGVLDTTIGRQYYGQPGDLNIYFGPKYNLFGMPITALDGARFDWNTEMVGVTAIGAKLSIAGTNATVLTGTGVSNTGDKSLWGADVHVKPADGVNIGASLYDRTTVNSAPNAAPNVNVVGNDILYVADVKAKVALGGFSGGVELAKDFGSNRTVTAGTGVYTQTQNYTGFAGKLDGAYKADTGAGAFTGWGQYGLGSGGVTPGTVGTTSRSFQAIAGDYRPGGIFGRFLSAGNFGSTLSDLQVIGIGVKANPSALSKLTAGLSLYNYRMQNTQQAGAFVTANNAGDAAISKDIGDELDLDLTWQHSENVSVTGGVGSLQPHGLIKDAFGGQGALPGGHTSPATLAYLDFSIKY